LKKCPTCGALSSDTDPACGVCGGSLSTIKSDVLENPSQSQSWGSIHEEVALDETILEIVDELSANLTIVGYGLKELVWTSNNACQPDLPTFTRKRLGLREELRGKLTLDEWRPILAASLVYYAKFRGRRLFGGLVYVLGAVLGFAVFIWFYYFVILRLVLPAGPVSGGTARGYANIVVVAFIGFVLLFGAITTPYHRRLIMLADRRTSEILGVREDLLRSLRKIESMSLPLESRIDRFIFRRLPLSERIHNLSEGSIGVAPPK